MRIGILLMAGLLLTHVPWGWSALSPSTTDQLWGGASIWAWAGCGLATGILLGLLAAPEPSTKALALAFLAEVISCWEVLFG